MLENRGSILFCKFILFNHAILVTTLPHHVVTCGLFVSVGQNAVRDVANVIGNDKRDTRGGDAYGKLFGLELGEQSCKLGNNFRSYTPPIFQHPHPRNEG